MTKAASAVADELADELAAAGVAGVHLAWADNNGIPRSRIVPVGGLAGAAVKGVGATSLFAVFDSHDAITYGHAGLATPSGDIRLVPVLERVRRLSGQPALAWAPARQLAADGSPWPYCQRTVLERALAEAGRRGLEFRAGYELEFTVAPADRPGSPGHPGPAYSPHALVGLDGIVSALLTGFAANGLEIGQLHAEYGASQLELSLAATDPLSAADDQLLARQTIHAAAHAHGLAVSFAPLVGLGAAGNGWHLHTSVSRQGRNLLSGEGRPSGEGAAYVGGLLRDLPALTAVTAPSVPSTLRLRPGFFAGAYSFWGVENREAPLRYVPGSKLLGPDHANVELKTSDASANPYLALAVVLAAGMAGIEDGAELPEPIGQDPGGWTEEERAARGVALLPASPQEQDAALLASPRVSGALGEELLGAFRAVRASDAQWAAERSLEEIVDAHRWRY
ncbi:glutamine synthetase family protein [Amycolatopsis sp. PS_44_ISF1]|uniref:glutamine synthetase family protein n=1 Tax=Amycolatopsis sp. PS_44_ISF1 TaxID=2974917 RepID=UPI0028DDCBCD|nr:glutamine synthetase family protein [Amycolatopsis sp. PS_44_ISF1]MDT8914130.1 glutamine synthetase family protein [Amycolatopsis sp. PS_44_ISF1]